MCRFDGDAMAHAVYFANGQALSYHRHWLRAPMFLTERNFGANLIPRVRSPARMALLTLTCRACPALSRL